MLIAVGVISRIHDQRDPSSNPVNNVWGFCFLVTLVIGSLFIFYKNKLNISKKKHSIIIQLFIYYFSCSVLEGGNKKVVVNDNKNVYSFYLFIRL